MTQGFDEWYVNYENKHEAYAGTIAIDAWNARHADVDELQKQIDNALDYVFGLYCTGDLDTERLENILKGDSNE